MPRLLQSQSVGGRAGEQPKHDENAPPITSKVPANPMNEKQLKRPTLA
ncbi:hypothetical protein J2046_005804 [Rhizobium petrolearium]|nr:hypothetical protein [Neorhizobium petrolearium]